MIQEVLNSLTLRDIIILVGILLAQIPFGIMIRYYYLTGIKDFALGGLILFTGSLSLLLTQFYFLQILPLYIIGNISFLTTYFLLFIHSLRYRWNSPPKYLLWPAIVTYAGIVISIFFYHIQAIQAVEDLIIGVEMIAIDRKTGGIPELAAVTSINGNIIIGNAFLYLIDFFRFCSSLLFFYVYFATELSYKTTITRRNRMIILVVAFLNMFHPVLITLVGLQFLKLPYFMFNIINTIMISLLAYVGMIHPETLSLSHTQSIRALSIYNLIEHRDLKTENESYFLGMNGIMKYIDNIIELRNDEKL